MRDTFDSGQAAIRAACELEGIPARPLASRMTDKSTGYGSSWEDQAARAGLIWRALQPLRGMPISILVARSAPRQTQCSCRRPCCSGRQPHPYWLEAIDTLAACALIAKLGIKRYDERKLILLSIFGERATFAEMAKLLQMDPQTVADHWRKIAAWIGIRAENGNESQAWREAEQLLSEAGILVKEVATA